jgi:hypothetical protein
MLISQIQPLVHAAIPLGGNHGLPDQNLMKDLISHEKHICIYM